MKRAALVFGVLATAILLRAGASLAQPLTIRHLAGSAGGFGWFDGTRAAARFNSPFGVVTDRSGNIYVADSGNHVIRRIDEATGAVTTLAGLAGSGGSTDGIGSAARFREPNGVAADGSGNVFVADTNNHTIRKIVVATGEVTTLAGLAGSSGEKDGIGSAARFANPESVTADRSGNVYVADTLAFAIRKIVVATGAVTTLAKGFGSGDGTGIAVGFSYPRSVAADGLGSVYVADSNNFTIRKIDVSSGTVTTLAGQAGSFGSADGTGRGAREVWSNGV